MRVFDNKIREHAATYINRIPLLHLGSPSHEFVIIAFYDKGAGLVAVFPLCLYMTLHKMTSNTPKFTGKSVTIF